MCGGRSNHGSRDHPRSGPSGRGEAHAPAGCLRSARPRVLPFPSGLDVLRRPAGAPADAGARALRPPHKSGRSCLSGALEGGPPGPGAACPGPGSTRRSARAAPSTAPPAPAACAPDRWLAWRLRRERAGVPPSPAGAARRLSVAHWSHKGVDGQLQTDPFQTEALRSGTLLRSPEAPCNARRHDHAASVRARTRVHVGRHGSRGGPNGLPQLAREVPRAGAWPLLVGGEAATAPVVRSCPCPVPPHADRRPVAVSRGVEPSAHGGMVAVSRVADCISVCRWLK